MVYLYDIFHRCIKNSSDCVNSITTFCETVLQEWLWPVSVPANSLVFLSPYLQNLQMPPACHLDQVGPIERVNFTWYWPLPCFEKITPFWLHQNDEVMPQCTIFSSHSSSGNFAETRDGLDSRGADRHRVSPNHPEFHQNSPRAVDEWGNELFLMF